jgi:hypothetical protein
MNPAYESNVNVVDAVALPGIGGSESVGSTTGVLLETYSKQRRAALQTPASDRWLRTVWAVGFAGSLGAASPRTQTADRPATIAYGTTQHFTDQLSSETYGSRFQNAYMHLSDDLMNRGNLRLSLLDRRLSGTITPLQQVLLSELQLQESDRLAAELNPHLERLRAYRRASQTTA